MTTGNGKFAYKTQFRPTISLLFLLSLIGCVSLTVNRDLATIAKLGQIKQDAGPVYDSFASDAMDNTKVAAFQEKLDDLASYEKNKGEKNAESVKIVTNIKDTFDMHVKNRKDEKWTPEYAERSKKNLLDMVGQAERNENAKKP